MVEEDEATGRVAAVFERILEQSPFVPSLFKSLAVCPPYLVLAWKQAAPALAGRDLPAAASRLPALVRDAATPPVDAASRELLRGFIGPLGRMLVLSCGLLAALKGELPGGRPASVDPPPHSERPLRRDVPSVWELPDATFGRTRPALDSPIINSVWRRVAGVGRLEAVWEHLEPQAPRTRPAAERLHDAALAAARQLPWDPVADGAALQAAGIGDATPGMAVILDAYAKTLSRVLALVACCDTD